MPPQNQQNLKSNGNGNPKYLFPVDLNIIVSKQNGKPILELRKVINDPEMIKYVLSNAWKGKQIPCSPVFRDRIKSIGSLINIGIVHYEQNTQEYRFVI